MIKTESAPFSSGIGTMQKTDGRIFSRSFLYDVKANIKNVNTGERFDGVIKDISGSGMGLTLPHDTPKETVLEISLEIPDGFGFLKLLGKVVWAKDSGFMGHRTGVSILNPRFMAVSRILELFF